MKQTTPCSS